MFIIYCVWSYEIIVYLFWFFQILSYFILRNYLFLRVVIINLLNIFNAFMLN